MLTRLTSSSYSPSALVFLSLLLSCLSLNVPLFLLLGEKPAPHVSEQGGCVGRRAGYVRMRLKETQLVRKTLLASHTLCDWKKLTQKSSAAGHALQDLYMY